MIHVYRRNYFKTFCGKESEEINKNFYEKIKETSCILCLNLCHSDTTDYLIKYFDDRAKYNLKQEDILIVQEGLKLIDEKISFLMKQFEYNLKFDKLVEEK